MSYPKVGTAIVHCPACGKEFTVNVYLESVTTDYESVNVRLRPPGSHRHQCPQAAS